MWLCGPASTCRSTERCEESFVCVSIWEMFFALYIFTEKESTNVPINDLYIVLCNRLAGTHRVDSRVLGICTKITPSTFGVMTFQNNGRYRPSIFRLDKEISFWREYYSVRNKINFLVLLCTWTWCILRQKPTKWLLTRICTFKVKSCDASSIGNIQGGPA